MLEKEKQMKNIKRKLCFAVFIILIITGSSYAHTLFANTDSNNDGTATITGMFSDGSSAAGLEFRLEDTNGKILLKDKMDQFGEYTFKIPDISYFIIIDGGSGHNIREKGPKK